MIETQLSAPVFKRTVQMRLAADELHFDLTLDEWPTLRDNEICNQNHSLTYRFESRLHGQGGYAPNALTPMGRIVFIPASARLRLRGLGGKMRHGRLEFPPGRFPKLDRMLANMPAQALSRCMDIRHIEVAHTLQRLIMEARQPDSASSDVLVSLGNLLSLDMARFLSHEDKSSAQINDPAIYFRHAVEQHMHSLPRIKVSINEISKAMNLSPRQFSRKFHQYYSQSFTDYLIKRRVILAESLLLKTRKSLKEIAYHCGYTDHAAFSKHFLAVTSTTPSNFRKQHWHRL